MVVTWNASHQDDVACRFKLPLTQAYPLEKPALQRALRLRRDALHVLHHTPEEEHIRWSMRELQGDDPRLTLW